MEQHKFKTVDEYLASLSGQGLEQAKAIRSIIKETLPDAEEKISYNMPTYKSTENLVHFAVAKNHMGFYPAPSGVTTFEEQFKARKYKYSKGAVQFPLDKTLPEQLIKDICQYRAEQAQLKLKKK